MPIRSLAEVGARLEETVRNIPDGDLRDPLLRYEIYESVAVAVLDSEHADFEPDALQAYLANFLAEKRIELGLGCS